MEKRKLKLATTKQKPILTLQVPESLQSFWILLVLLSSIRFCTVDFCTSFVNGSLFFFPSFQTLIMFSKQNKM